MGYDLVTWAPMIGGEGEDKYDPPEETLWAAGLSDNYSDIPTIEEINAGRDFNQVIAAVNRRTLRYNALFGTALNALSYWPTDSSRRINLADLALIRNAITAVRHAEGFAAYSWASLTSGNRDWARYLGELRQALRICGTLTLQHGTPMLGAVIYEYLRTDSPFWGNLYSQTLTSPGATTYVGQRYSGGYRRYRRVLQCAIPDWLSSAVSSVFQMTVNAAYNSPVAELWSSNTVDHPPNYTAPYHLDNLESSAALAPGTYEMAVSLSRILERTGSWLSLILGEHSELAHVYAAFCYWQYVAGGWPRVVVTLGD